MGSSLIMLKYLRFIVSLSSNFFISRYYSLRPNIYYSIQLLSYCLHTLLLEILIDVDIEIQY